MSLELIWRKTLNKTRKPDENNKFLKTNHAEKMIFMFVYKDFLNPNWRFLDRLSLGNFNQENR